VDHLPLLSGIVVSINLSQLRPIGNRMPGVGTELTGFRLFHPWSLMTQKDDQKAAQK